MNSGNFYIPHPEKGKSPPWGAPGLRKLRLLVAPLDWGLGHATRCIPIIYELIRQNCEPWIAADGAQQTLLKQEFPDLSFINLPGYNVKYGRSATSTVWNILMQSGKITRAISDENNWLKKAAREHQFDAVISDNRYGLYHSDIPSIFITHQLAIKSPWGKWSEGWIQNRNYARINHFTECWVPDGQGQSNLAGDLSHPKKKPAIPLKYIGPLSRFEKIESPVTSSLVGGDLLIVLSGPEPQRSIFEDKIIRDIAHYPGSATIVRGLPGALTLVPSSNSIKFYNHLSAGELNIEMNKAEYIISRSGYSTIMDLAKLRKKSILVPTPGQTEQEYLSKYLQGKKISLSVNQKSFSLTSALQLAKSFPYSITGIDNENNLQQVISGFLQSLQGT